MTTSLTERIARLGPAQRELLERRLDPPPAAGAPLAALASEGPAPASPTQKSMWFVHHLDPASPVFNNGNAVRIRGPLDVEALSGALADLVGRHEVLRTTYGLMDGELMQLVQPAPETVLEIRDTPAPPGDLTGEVRRQIEAEASRPFDLERDLMYRAVLFRLSDEDHVLVRSSHHIAFDRWSVAIANEELGELYRARRAGTEPKVPDLRVQYTDFARWQLDALASDKAGARLRFFTSHIAGVPGFLDVPTDHTRGEAQGPAATLSRPLAGDLSTRIRGVARDLGATPFMLLLAVYGALMGRFTRSDQLIVGVPVALRGEPELTDMLGPFINTVALRLDLRGEPTFGELVERTRRTSLNMIAHQDLPFDELVRAVAPDRVANRTPLFQVMFDYLNTPHVPLELEGLDLEWAPLEPPTTAHDITLYIEDQPSGIACRWEYRADLFDRATVGALAGAFEVLAARLVAAPGTRVSEVGLLGDRDEQRVRSLGAGPVLKTEPSHLLDALEAQRSNTPDAVAAVSDGNSYTYDELALTARRVAVGLGGQGVRPGDTVALLLDRSFDLIAGFLGVLMAGGTAVLLDRDQPERRLTGMLGTMAPTVVLGDPGLEPGFRTHTFDSLVAGVPEAFPPSFSALIPLGPGDPAYVVFTSGSTGTPKGVVVGHGSLQNFVAAAASSYGVGPEDRVLQFASPGFDTFVEEVLPALSTGATVVLRPIELFPTFTAFEDFVAESGVTILDLPTAWWSSWVSDLLETGRRVPPGVRMVIVGGEAARAGAWKDWTRVAGDVRWVNSYGPSEGTVVVATFEPSPAYRPTGAVMPIGRPIQNASLLVVDPDGHPLPPRLTGELVIEGAPVALGYVGSSALPPSAEGITPAGPVPDGAGFETDHSGRRSYRTGDLARLLPDGTFEFVGRIDSQVKVRGTRVEPAEVEAALREHPGITDAVVVPNRDGEPGLVGHIVATDPALDPPSIRRHLVGRLPEPMIPSGWQFHDSLPMTPGGKPDRRLLERIDTGPKPERNGRIRPRSEMETKLFEIWAGVLGTSDISVTDSFFDLGGHSLLGVKMISRISSTLNMGLPLRAIFETPTIESMAKLLETADA